VSCVLPCRFSSPRADRFYSEPYIAPFVQTLHISTYAQFPTRAHSTPEAFISELTRTIPHLESVRALRIEWQFDIDESESGLGPLADVPRLCWLQFAPRLTRLSIKIDPTHMAALAGFAPSALYLEQLCLRVDGYDPEQAAQDSQSWYRIVSALILPGRLTLVRLELSFLVAARRTVQCTGGMIGSNQMSTFCIGPIFDALAEIHFPRLNAFAVGTPFGQAGSCFEEDALLRIISTHPLQSLSIVPTPVLTTHGMGGDSHQYSAAYNGFLARAAGLQHPTAMSQLRRLCMRVPDDAPEQIASVERLCSLPSSLEELQLTGNPVSEANLCRIITGLEHLRSLRAVIDGLSLSLLDYLVNHMSTIQELNLTVDSAKVRQRCDIVSANGC
jgi:hypothetical protein